MDIPADTDGLVDSLDREQGLEPAVGTEDRDTAISNAQPARNFSSPVHKHRLRAEDGIGAPFQQIGQNDVRFGLQLQKNVAALGQRIDRFRQITGLDEPQNKSISRDELVAQVDVIAKNGWQHYRGNGIPYPKPARGSLLSGHGLAQHNFYDAITCSTLAGQDFVKIRQFCVTARTARR